MRRIVNWFLQGLIFVVPIALTIWLFVAVFSAIDGWLGLPVPGLGLLALLIFVTLVGALATNFLTRQLLGLFERALDRLPFARLLHTSVKDLMSAFVGEKRRFTRPVLVEMTPGGVKAFGFVTREKMAPFALADHVAVYFPQSYNFAGQVVVVPRERVTPVAVDSAEVMAFIVSGGVTGA